MPRRATAAATPLVRAFSRELSRAGGLLSPDYLASGMSVGEARCLYDIGHSDGFAISALAEQLDLDLGYVSRVVSRLAARGLVSKRVADGDARARSVVITARGARQLAALEQRADKRLDDWLAAKPRAAVDRLVVGLEGLFGAGEGRVTIRGPRPGSIGHIIARHAEIYAELGYPPVFEHYVVQAFASFVEDFTPPRDRIFIAEHTGGHTGRHTGQRTGRFVGSIASKGLPNRVAQLRFLIVEPEARGHGLGHRLVQSVIDHARASGDRRIVLDTASDLGPARALYTAHGFQLTGSTDDEPFLPRGVASERWELAL